MNFLLSYANSKAHRNLRAAVLGVVALFTMFFQGSIYADDTGSLLQTSLVQTTIETLKGSSWEGSFRLFGSFDLYDVPIRIVFLPNLNAKGELMYRFAFDDSRLPGPVKAVFTKDVICPYTPRGLVLKTNKASPGQIHGKIHIYACAASADIEANLEADPHRPAKFPSPIRVRKVSLSADHKNLQIIADFDIFSFFEVPYTVKAHTDGEDPNLWLAQPPPW